VGEVSCTGLHGGNRLASTSLLEGLVFGTRAGHLIATTTPKNLKSEIRELRSSIPPWNYLGKFPADSALIASDATTIKNIMWNMVGLVRKTPLLERAISDLSQMENTINKFYRDAYLTDELLGLRNLVLVALITAKAAYANPRSIGCHFREA
jgi:L-aspartate oxidase